MSKPSSEIQIAAPCGWRWQHSFETLPDSFFKPAQPLGAKEPWLVVFNDSLAKILGLDARVLKAPQGVRQLSGNALPIGSNPIAQAYAGHQFGNFTMLGDGRALLLGEHVTPDEHHVDIQLKGSGPTPFSRGGDGRAALGPMLREHLIAEAMHGLGIPTARSLGVVATGENVMRETPLPGAVLTRVADSHLRIGTFEYAARFVGTEGLKFLADYAIHRHFPELRQTRNPYREFWLAVSQCQAELVARWMGVGFVHGVMNTDNVAIAGQTLDYGPCAFLDRYDSETVFSSIDRFGRYAYGNQPTITQWNLARFAEALLPLLDKDPNQALDWAREAVEQFGETYRQARLSVMRRKLGLFNVEPEDEALADDLLDLMQSSKSDFTNTFRALSDLESKDRDRPNALASTDFTAWQARWSQRQSRQAQANVKVMDLMQTHNPAYIPRNHRVESTLAAAVEQGDFKPYRRLLRVLTHPFDEQPDTADLRVPAPPTDPPYRTYCGT